MDPTAATLPDPAAPADQPSGPGWLRWLGRLLVDAVAVLAMGCAVLVLPAALAALVDVALRGPDGFSVDAGAARDALTSTSRETLALASLVFGMALYLALIVAIFALARIRRGANWRNYLAWRGFRPDRLYWALLAAAIVVGLLAGLAIDQLDPNLKKLMIMPKDVVGLLITFALAVIVGPLCEELIFRGWIYTALRQRMGFVATLLISSVLFAAAHWEGTHLYALAVFPLSLMLGYLRERTGSVCATAVFHGLYNFSAWMLSLASGP